jgi:type IV secretory pathway protease TraF
MPYVTTSSSPINGHVVPVIDQADWRGRIVAAIEELRASRKGAIILYDERTNTVRIYDGRARVSIQAE